MSSESSSLSPGPRKRRREPQDVDGTIATKKKPKRSKSSKKGAGGDIEDFDVENGLNNAIAKMDSQLLADFLAQRTRRHAKDLSSLELQDMYLPGTCMACNILDMIVFSSAESIPLMSP
jgi:protein CMS1